MGARSRVRPQQTPTELRTAGPALAAGPGGSGPRAWGVTGSRVHRHSHLTLTPHPPQGPECTEWAFPPTHTRHRHSRSTRSHLGPGSAGAPGRSQRWTGRVLPGRWRLWGNREGFLWHRRQDPASGGGSSAHQDQVACTEHPRGKGAEHRPTQTGGAPFLTPEGVLQNPQLETPGP